VYSVTAIQRVALKLAILLIGALVPFLLMGQDRNTLLRQAVSALRDQRPGEALSVLEPLLQSQPDDYKALTLMGVALAAEGKHEDAIRAFEHALQVQPANPTALQGLAAAEMMLKLYDQARNHFQRLLELTPGDPTANAGLGEIAFLKSKFAEAVQHFERSGSVYQKDPRLLLEYAKANLELKQESKAAEALASLPEEAAGGFHFEAGSMLASMKHYDAAAQQFELALRNYPDKYAAGFNLVLALVNAQKYKEAIDTGQKLIASGNNKAELYNVLSEAYEKSGDTRQAYDSLRTATQIEPLDEANYVDLITLCIEHRNYDLAAEIARIGLAKLPDSERLHLQYGVVLAMKTQFENASKQFESAAKLRPERSLPQVAQALVSMQMNKPDEAVSQLRSRARQYPDDYLVLWFLGEALDRSGIVPGSPGEREAIEALERSVQLNPNISQSQELLGKLLVRDGRLDEAAAHLERAITLDSGNVGAIYQLAQVCNRKGDTSRAKQLFATVSKMKADDRENFAARGLQQILRADPKM
jgi:tetratricopeptide (TPR) repeat protein